MGLSQYLQAIFQDKGICMLLNKRRFRLVSKVIDTWKNEDIIDCVESLHITLEKVNRKNYILVGN